MRREYIGLCLISLAGFLITAFVPLGIEWDSNHILKTQVLQSEAPNNWMGWFLPFLWKALYTATGLPKSIGFFTCLLYWLSLSFLYFMLRKDAVSLKNYLLGYTLFAFNPFVFPSFLLVMNNTLQLSFLLAALLLFTAFRFFQNRVFLLGACAALCCSILVRRDALFTAVPLMVYFSSHFLRRRVFSALVFSGLFLGALVFTDNAVRAGYPDYGQGIDTIGLTALFDAVNMSAYKKQLLVPREVFKPELPPEEILNEILDTGVARLLFEWMPFQNRISPLLKSGTVWRPEMPKESLVPLYRDNWPIYLWMRVNMAWAYMIQLFPFLCFGGITFFLVLHKKFSKLFEPQERRFYIMLSALGLFYTAVIMVSVLSVQLRYLLSAFTLIYLPFVLCMLRFFTRYSIRITPKP